MLLRAWFLASLTVLGLSQACKSTSSTTQAAGLVMPATGKGLMPANWRVFPAKDLRYVLKPYIPQNPLFNNLAGIQFCRGKCDQGKIGLATGVVGMGLAKAVEDGNSLSFAIKLDNNYAFQDRGQWRDMLQADPNDNDGYQITFQDETHARLIPGKIATGDSRFFPSQGPATNYTMELVEPDHWVRHSLSPGTQTPLPDYDLYNIIDRDGNETKFYQLYVDDLAKSGVQTLVTPVLADSLFGKGGPVPTGPFRDVDRTPAGQSDSGRDAKDAAGSHDSSNGSGASDASGTDLKDKPKR